MAAIKINFDSDHNPLVPTFILGDRMGNNLELLITYAILIFLIK